MKRKYANLIKILGVNFKKGEKGNVHFLVASRSRVRGDTGISDEARKHDCDIKILSLILLNNIYKLMIYMFINIHIVFN